MTGDVKYLKRAEQAIKSFETYLKVKNNGYAGLFDVNDNSSDRQMIDDTTSFWFAEVLKYLYVDILFYFIQKYQPFFLRARYLTFDDPKKFSLDECKISIFFSLYFCSWLLLMEHHV